MSIKIKSLGHRMKGRFHDVASDIKDKIAGRKYYHSLKSQMDIPTALVDFGDQVGKNKKYDELFFDRYLEKIFHMKNVEAYPYTFVNFWKRTSPSFKESHKELFFELLDNAKSIFPLVEELWGTLSRNEQENMMIEVMSKHKEALDLVVGIWKSSKPEIRKYNDSLWLQVMELLEDQPRFLMELWHHTSPEIQKTLSDTFPELIKKIGSQPELIETTWECTNVEVKKASSATFAEIIEVCKKNPSSLATIWLKTPPEIIKEYASLLPEIVDICADRWEDLIDIWKRTSLEVQENNKDVFLKILNIVSNKESFTTTGSDIWKWASLLLIENHEDIYQKMMEMKGWVNAWGGQKEKQIEHKELFSRLLGEINSADLYKLWGTTCSQIQGEHKDVFLTAMNQLLEKTDKMSENQLHEAWIGTAPSIQREFLHQFLEKTSNPSMALILWRCMPEINHIWYLSKGKCSPFLVEQMKDYLGDEKLISEDGTILLPENLKSVLSQELTDKQAREIRHNLPAIIKQWPQIEKQFQYIKANAITGNGLEYRNITAKDVLTIINALNRPKPTNASAEEFERTKGAEKVGMDTQFTESVETAVPRAHDVATRMDKAGTKKTFPDFSCESADGEARLICFHPQDKGQMLLGFDAHCCFRPNGNADNSGINEHSLLQYCTTTPYGGVLKIESKDGSKVLMGTPFLTNGNMMMFHSYETALGTGSGNISKEQALELCKKSNDLLVDAAQKAIELSNGTLNVVFMTNLHTRRRIFRYR